MTEPLDVAVTEPLDLAEFEPATNERWQARLDGEAGKSVVLASALDDGQLAALHPMAPGRTFAAPRVANAQFAVGSEYALADPRRLAAALRADFTYGLESAWVRMHPSSRARVSVPATHRGGLVVAEREDVAAVVAAVPSPARLVFDAGANALSIYAMALEAKPVDGVAALVLSDPLGAWVESGVLGVELEDAMDDQAKLVAWAKVETPDAPVLLASGTMFHDAGASASIELGAVVATALAYVRSLAKRGHAPSETLPRLILRCSVDSDVFESIGKVRALRNLWARLSATLDTAAPAPVLSVRAGWRNRTRHDPWVNMVRGTVEGFAAMVGGADEVCFQPSSEVVGVPAQNARRWAIGTGLVLRDESHLNKVLDPAAGSGAVEAVTGMLVEKAWAFVRDIERAGGMAAAVDKGLPQKATAAVAHRRRAALARCKFTITGVNLYPNLDEGTMAVSPPVDAMRTPAYEGEPVHQALSLEPVRLAAPFEALRDDSDRYLAEHGVRPVALIVELGDPAAHTARLDFTRSTVEVGGFKPSVVPWRDTPPAASPHVKLVVLCAVDEVLEAQAPDVVQALRAAGFGPVIIATSPRDIAESVRECADGFFHRGTEIVSVMSDLQSAARGDG